MASPSEYWRCQAKLTSGGLTSQQVTQTNIITPLIDRMATKVKLKFLNKQSPTDRLLVLQTASQLLKTPFTRLFDTGDGFKAVCRNSDDVDKILGKKGIDEFKKIGIQVVTPPEVRAQRSVFVRQLDRSFGAHTAEETKIELEDKNDWMVIDEVIKIGTYTHVLKIRFAETCMADKALRDGFTGFNLSIIPEQIKREEYVNLLICFACYQYEDHPTAECPHKDNKICSNCAETGHTFRDCQNAELRKCVNCTREGRQEYNTHKTMAMSCPVKKRAISEKKDKEKQREANKQQHTYAEIAKQAVKEAGVTPLPPPQATVVELSSKTDYQVMVCLLYAHVMNLANPGTFEKEMNELLRLNGMPAMKFPPNPDSQKALRINGTPLHDSDVTPFLGTMPDDETEPRQRTKIHKDDESDAEFDSDESTSTNVSVTGHDSEPELSEAMPIISAKKPRKAVVTTSQLGLRLYYGKKHPQQFNDNKQIGREIQTGTVKFTYTNLNYSQAEVLALISSPTFSITRDDFIHMDAKSFAKVTNGNPEYSPESPALTPPLPPTKGREKRTNK